ncbi:MAG: hypothetical protein V8Q54_07915 [Alistipes senegalensis]
MPPGAKPVSTRSKTNWAAKNFRCDGFDLTEQLADIYSSYQSDSSLLYFRRGLELAERIGDNDLTMRARSSIALCYSLGGRFYEAEEILNAISDTVSVSRRALQSYYVAQHRKNRELCYLTEPGARRDVSACANIITHGVRRSSARTPSRGFTTVIWMRFFGKTGPRRRLCATAC